MGYLSNTAINIYTEILNQFIKTRLNLRKVAKLVIWIRCCNLVFIYVSGFKYF